LTEARVRTATVTVILGALIALALASSASAELKIHESRRTKPTSAQNDAVTATCPKGESAISGGYTVPRLSSITGLFQPTGSFPNENGWQASVSQIGSDLKEGFVTSFAYCAKLGKDIETTGDSTSLGTREFTDLTATCKRNQRIVSGGWAFSASLGSSSSLLASVKQGSRSWRVTGGMNTGTGTLIVIADCAPKNKAPDLVTRKDTGKVTSDVSTVTSSCKKKEQAVSAGFSSNTRFEPFEFHRGAKRTWGMRGEALIADGRAAVFTYCEKKDKKRGGGGRH
jgi:hypothetical protein